MVVVAVAAGVLGCTTQHAQPQQPPGRSSLSGAEAVATPASNAPAQADCPAGAGPDRSAVQAAVAQVPKLSDDVPWYPDASGNTRDCALFWTSLSAHGTASTPDQLMFFHGRTFVGTATPEPRPYMSVVDSGQDTVTVRYAFIVGDEPNCCPAGKALVRFRLAPGGGVEALDPIPPR